MQKQALFWAAALGAWLAVVGLGQWGAAEQAQEPPSWDTYSYAVKAAKVWDALEAGTALNPLNAEPTVRPPGTVLVSYPFGFEADFRGYYFRSVFLPVLLCALAAYVAAFTRRAPPGEPQVLAAAALAMAGLPMFFQFQFNDALPGASFWGMVDGALTGVAALAMACAVRAVRQESVGWALGAAALAALAFMVKPAGALVMALVGAAWLLLDAERHGWRVRVLRSAPLLGAAAIFLLTAAAAFSSAYFSSANVAFGRAALAVMAQDFMALDQLTPAELWLLLKLSVGGAGLALLALGVLAAVAARSFHALAAAVACLGVGLWFWLFEAGAEVVRYFLPFPAMAMVVLLPAVVQRLGRWSAAPRAAVGAVLAAPGLITTGLLLMPAPPLSWQRALGVNLVVNAYPAENAQGAALLAHWRAHGETGRAYFFDTSAPIRNVYAVIEFAELAEPGRAVMQRTLPLDWRRTSTFRLAEIAASRYLIFEPVRDDAARRAILSQNNVANYRAETEVLNAWASGLGAAQGITVLSDGRVRVAEVTDATAFTAALDALRDAYRWSQAFRDANRPSWWSVDELGALINGGEARAAQALFSTEGAASGVMIEAATLYHSGEGLHVDVWVSGAAPGGPWVLFGHLLDGAGTMVGNAQADLVDPSASPDKPIRLYRLLYPPQEAGVTVGLGFFTQNPAGLQTLTTAAQPSSWDGRRYDVDVPVEVTR